MITDLNFILWKMLVLFKIKGIRYVFQKDSTSVTVMLDLKKKSTVSGST